MPSNTISIVDLPASFASATVTRTGPNSIRATIEVKGTSRPSARTDIVFVLDVSSTNREAIESGLMTDTVWKVLEYVNQFDDDGIDFFLASTLLPDGPGPQALVAALEAGKAPTDAELAAAHGYVSAGQAATREDLSSMLALDGSTIGIAGVLAPALRAAKSKRKPTGRLFIEVVTDGRIVDGAAVIQEIAQMSRECETASDKARYRIHVLGLGDVDESNLEKWDSGLGEVAPIDIVATDVASAMSDGASRIFKEMRRSFMSVCPMALIEVGGAGLSSARAMGSELPVDESESNKFVESREQLPPEIVFDLSYAGAPTPTTLAMTLMREDGTEESLSLIIPVP